MFTQVHNSCHIMDPNLLGLQYVDVSCTDDFVFEISYMKGDDVQKLSVIQALPQLLQFDHNETITRILPKIQQELPKSSCEFHIATSKIFRLLIEKQLPLNLMTAVFQGSGSKDPIVAGAWNETLLAVIPILAIDQIKTEVLPTAISKSQSINSAFDRVCSCKILGRVAVHPKIQPVDVKTNILPVVQSLCQDVSPDVRAAMCSHLHFIAQGLGDNFIKSSLLPSLVELASDGNMNVRSSAVASVVLIVPFLTKQTRIDTIVPLLKQLCQKSQVEGDITFLTISKEFGKIVDALQNDLDANDGIWFLNYFKQLSRKGYATQKVNLDASQAVLCREQCAYNLPAVTYFTIMQIPTQSEVWHSIFSDLANDPCYLVRKTVAGCIHEITKILGPQCKIIRQDLAKLLRDDAEEVLQLLVPNLGTTLEYLANFGVLSKEQTFQSTLEIARAMLKCQMELSKGYNWRIKTCFLQQLEHLPSCMPSDFIHQHFTPVLLNYAIEPTSKPVKSQATRTLLIFLRYNLKEIQRKWVRDNLIQNLCYSQSCYTRHIFIHMCGHAMEIFSNEYFKKFFFEPLLSLASDPVSNIRLCVANIFPSMFKMLNMPEDRKLQLALDGVFSKMEMTEKDKDVRDVLKIRLKEMRTITFSNKCEMMLEERKKQEEENRIMQGKSIVAGAIAGPKPVGSVPLADQSHQSKPQSAVSKSGSASYRSASPKSGGQPQRDMSLLEHHFYVDAGVSLPHNHLNREIGIDVIGNEIPHQLFLDTNEQKNIKCLTKHDFLPLTLSFESIVIDTLTEVDLKQLEMSATNITDDIKVNLRDLNNRHAQKNSPIKKSEDSKLSTKNKRHSNIITPSYFKNNLDKLSKETSMKRRSLNITNRELSKIPVWLKKSNCTSEGQQKVEATNLIQKKYDENQSDGLMCDSSIIKASHLKDSNTQIGDGAKVKSQYNTSAKKHYAIENTRHCSKLKERNVLSNSSNSGSWDIICTLGDSEGNIQRRTPSVPIPKRTQSEIRR